jgi:hypothetical protein
MIHITKQGFEHLEWDKTSRQNVKKKFVSYDCMREGVTEVEEGVTLADIISFTAQDEILSLFIGAYSGCNVPDFEEELKQGVEPLSPTDNVKYCTVAMEVRVWSVSKRKGSKTLEVTLDFCGCGDEKQQYALDLAALPEIAALPFRLGSNASFGRFAEDSAEQEDGLEYTPNLLEVLDAIFFDLSFHGSPAEKAERRKEIEQRIQAIEDGTATLIPLDLEEEQDSEG